MAVIDASGLKNDATPPEHRSKKAAESSGSYGSGDVWMKIFAMAIFALAMWHVWSEKAVASIKIERVAISNSAPILVIRGEFDQGDTPVALDREVASTGAKIVTFESNGGNVAVAIEFGRAIRSLGLNTFQLRSSQCASACTLTFLGGVIHNAEAGSIGVHQSSFSPGEKIDGQQAVAAVQAMTAQIITYMIEMGVDPRLLQLSLSVQSSDMRYLTSSEMAQYRVTTDGSTIDPAVPARDETAASTTTQGNSGETQRPEAAAATDSERALVFLAKYHDAWSLQNGQAMEFMRAAYADESLYYGKSTSKDVVLRNKETFARRWPIRAYSVRYGSERVDCGRNCTVSGIVEWFAASPERGNMPSGAAEFVLVWNPSTEKVQSEIGKVVSTDRRPSGPVRIIAQWQDDDNSCRGGHGDSPETMKACDRREVITAKLEALGLCYGREGEQGYQMDWHICGR
jgi:hypothetical protein